MGRFLAFVSLSISLFSTSAFAEVSSTCRAEFGGRAATLVVPNAAGGGYDTYARSIAPVLSELTGLRVQVANVEAGGGRVAYERTLAADASDFVMLISDVTDVAISERSGGSALDGLDTLGIVHVAPTVWVMSDRIAFGQKEWSHLITAQGTLEDAMFAVKIGGLALGVETDVVAGYNGSSEFVAAVLRGDVDMTTLSLETAIKRIKGNAAHIGLILSDGPIPEAPDVPYLAGEGGLAEAFAANLPEAERIERARLARIATDLSQSVRAIFIARTVPGDLRDCLRSGIAETLDSQELHERLAAQDRPLSPIKGQDAVAKTKAIMDALEDSRSIIETMTSEQ